MAAVFFVYGLAFFILGFAITFYPKKDSEFKLADHLYLVAGFGLLHGINEWLDMFLMIEPYAGMRGLVLLRAFTLPVSFICLVQFGSRCLGGGEGGYRWLRPAAPVLWAVWLGAFFSGERTLLMWDIWSRYLLCLPGAALTGWALARQLPEMKKTDSPGVARGLRIASGSFFAYAVIAGAIVKEAEFFPASVLNYPTFTATFGAPVQVFRAVCALAMAYGIMRVLSVFNWEARNRVRQSDLRFRTIAGEAPVMLFMADGEGRVSFVEGRALEATGITAEAAVGRPVEEVFAGAPSLAEQCRKGLEGTESTSTVEMRGRWLEVFVGPAAEGGTGMAGIVGVGVDVTERVQSQAELGRYRGEMARMRQMATVGTLGERMARQVEEPLGVARVLLRRLMRDLNEGASEKDIYKHLRSGLTEIKKAADSVRAFYADARISPPSAAAPVDVKAAVQKVIAVFEESAGHAGMELRTGEMDAASCLKIPGRQLEQVFFIMVQNAIDASEEGKKNSLTISAEVSEGELVVRFTDDCGGIPAERLERIFEPFMQSEVGTRDSGLGLAVAQRIIQGYGGDIRAESRPGEGTTFEVRLPTEGEPVPGSTV